MPKFWSSLNKKTNFTHLNYNIYSFLQITKMFNHLIELFRREIKIDSKIK